MLLKNARQLKVLTGIIFTTCAGMIFWLVNVNCIDHRHEYQFKRIILVRPDRRLSSTELDCSGSASFNFADHKKAIRPRVQSGEVEIIPS